MTATPDRPKIYHITHVSNLSHIIRDGVLWSDQSCASKCLDCTQIGLTDLKRRRLEQLRVKCHAETFVGEYVPFYFCPRSIMLYILHMGNLPGLTYRGGQQPIIHLEADLESAIRWADDLGIRWAFSNMNAGARLAEFFKSRDDLPRINWDAVRSDDFRHEEKEGKQAEFLMHGSFPWRPVERIGVCCQKTLIQVQASLADASHKPLASVVREWYF